jgi:hypothetical protein
MEHKVYRYQKHIRHWPYTVPTYIGVQFAFYMVPVLTLVLPGTTVPATQIVVFVALILFLLAVSGGTLACLFHRMEKTEVSIEDGTLVYATRSEVRKIPLEEIVGLRFPSLTYAGGWLKIETSGKSVCLTTAIEDFAGFLLELKVALDEQQLSDRYDRRTFFQFLKTATFLEQSWTRVCRILWGLLSVVGLGTVVCLVLMAVLELGNTGVALLTCGALILPLIMCMGAEFELGRRFAKATDEERFYCRGPDLELENKVYREAAWVGGLIYVVGMVGVVLAQM